MRSRVPPVRADEEPVTIRSAEDLRAVLQLGSTLVLTRRRSTVPDPVVPLERESRGAVRARS